MAQRLKKNDLVKIISGKQKGQVARITKILTDKNQALLEGIGQRVRHVRRSYYNPAGSKHDIQVGVKLSKLALVVDEKAQKTSRVGYKLIDGKKVRVARQLKDKEIK